MNPVFCPPYVEEGAHVVQMLQNMPSKFTSAEIAFGYGALLGNLTLKIHRNAAFFNMTRMTKSASHLNANELAIMRREMLVVDLYLQMWDKAFVIMKMDNGVSDDYMSTWDKAFEALSQGRVSQVTIPTFEQMMIVHVFINSLVLKTAHETWMDTEECVFDGFFNRFQGIIGSVRYMFPGNRDCQLLNRWVIQLGLSLVQNLYYVATRCRDTILRRESINMLTQVSAKSGSWESIQAVRVASWVVNLEEKERDEEGSIPEPSRVRMNTLKWTLDGRRIAVACIQDTASDGWKLHNIVLTA
jgi:hypothetical protein